MGAVIVVVVSVLWALGIMQIRSLPIAIRVSICVLGGSVIGHLFAAMGI